VARKNRGTEKCPLEGSGSAVGERVYANIHIVNRDGSGSVRLSHPDNVDAGPAWSPDGSRIAFQSVRDGNPELYVMNADGGGLQRLTDNPAEDGAAAWSPDGSRIAFETNRDGNWEIYVVAADGSDPTNLTRSSGQERTPAWR